MTALLTASRDSAMAVWYIYPDVQSLLSSSAGSASHLRVCKFSWVTKSKYSIVMIVLWSTTLYTYFNYVIQDCPLSSLKSVICERFGVEQADVLFICGGEILNDDRTFRSRPKRITIANGTRIVLQKVPLTVNVAEQDVNLKVSMPQVFNWLTWQFIIVKK